MTSLSTLDAWFDANGTTACRTPPSVQQAARAQRAVPQCTAPARPSHLRAPAPPVPHTPRMANRIELFQSLTRMEPGGLQTAPPLPGPAPPLPPAQNGYGSASQHQQHQQKRKKRGKRGSGLGPSTRPFKQPRAPQQLGFFGQVPNLQDLRQENWRRTQQHFAGPASRGAFQQSGGQQHGRNRRSRPKGPKAPKLLSAPRPRPSPLTPAAGNPLDTPANIGKLAAVEAGAGTDKLEAEGLQSGLDWYGTNENSAALFLATHLSSSESDRDDEEGSDGEAHSGGDAAPGGGEGDDAPLPRHVQARLVEQEAYIEELEDQNLRLREQLEMLQQEMDDLRGHGHDSEGYAEHSEGSLPADLSVMQQQP